MRCPSCQRPIDHEADSCYSCNYSFIHAVRRFGSNQVRLKRIHDAADCLRVKEIYDLAETLNRLERTFPQLVFVVYLGELNRSISIGELSFWLINQSHIEGADESVTNDNAVLLMLDVETSQAGISLGYQTELLLSEEDCSRALKAGRSAFLNNEFGNGVSQVLRKLEKSLIKKAKNLKHLTREERRAWMSADQLDNSLSLPAHHALTPMAGDEALPMPRARRNTNVLIEK